MEGKKGEEHKWVQNLGGSSSRNVVLIMLNGGIPDKLKWFNDIETLLRWETIGRSAYAHE